LKCSHGRAAAAGTGDQNPVFKQQGRGSVAQHLRRDPPGNAGFSRKRSQPLAKRLLATNRTTVTHLPRDIYFSSA
jgi:hypothetical protein